jgi:flagellar biosynthesis/type III secretory pathway chaperone
MGLEELLAELESLLRDELSAYTHLVNRLPFKIALIKKNRAAQFERLIAQESGEMQVLDGLERQRAEVSEAIARMLPQPARTLNEMLPLIAPAWRERLAPLGSELRAKVDDLQAGNQTCRDMLRLSIDYAAFTLDLIAQAATPEGMVYDGSVAQAPSLLVDRRA